MRQCIHHLVSSHTEVVRAIEFHHINPQRMWIHGFLHRCTFSSHLFDWILKAMWKQTELDKTNLIKIGSLPPRESPRSFQSNLLLRTDCSSNPHAVLRSTHDLTNSPNAVSRSTHDLRQTAADALRITRYLTTNLGCSDTNCCAQDNNPSEEFTNQAETWCSRRCTQ